MPKSSDEIKELQRSINRLEGTDGAVLPLGGQAYLVPSEAVVDPDVLLDLMTRGTVSEAEALAGLSQGCRLERPARRIEGRWLGALQRDLKILETHPDLAAGLTRQAPRLFRGRTIDRDWLTARRARLDRLQEACAREAGAPDGPPLWDAALTAVRRFHGAEAAEALGEIRERSTRLSAERRRDTLERVEELLLCLEGAEPSGAAPELAAFLDGAVQQLRRIEQLPGRARRKRLRQIMPAVLAWPGEPGSGTAGEPEIDLTDSLPQQIRSLALHWMAQQGSTRAPEFQERLILCLARFGLSFPPGPAAADTALRFDEPLLETALRRWLSARTWLAGLPLRLEQVMDLLTLKYPDGAEALFEHRLATVGRWVADGLEIPLLREVARLRLLNDLLHEDWDVATVRAYCVWVAKLAPHYRQQGIRVALTAKGFSRLRAARHEELAILGHCLMTHHAPAAGEPSARQIALLDATLALFQKLPDKARRCLEGIELAPAGLGARICPDFAAWLEHDPDLDRYLHLCGLLGLPQVPSKNLLRDFELAARRAAELAHLASLAGLNEAQQQRLARLSQAGPPPEPGWTKRRLAERNEALTLQLLERRIDQVLAEVLRRAYGLSLDRVTPAWRDVFRFYLAGGRNQELLGTLLRNASARPGRYFPPSLPKNREWLERARGRMDVDAWLRPRRRVVEIGGERFTLAVEEDPVEVLRMGVPFNTCLSIEGGSNAGATVLNALDVNKRVLYLRAAAGTPVARQLIAVSSGFTFLRYRLYAAHRPPELEQAFRGLCEEIAREAGLPLGDQGEPERLHDGFWYDDGVRSFAQAVPASVEDYCRRFLELPVPPEPDRGLPRDAELWEALCAKDARRFAAAAAPLHLYKRSHVELAARLVAALGIGKLTRLYRSGVRNLLPVLLLHGAEQGAEGLLRAARRLGVTSLEAEDVCEILLSLPLSPAAVREMAGLGADVVARPPLAEEHGIEHGSMSLLPSGLGTIDLAGLFDMSDRLSPVWARVVRESPGCSGCRSSAESSVLAAAEGAFLRGPDTRLVVACLRSRRRSDLARRIALRILGRFPFPRQRGQSPPVSAIRAPEPALADAPWVRKALRELAVRHPAVGRSPEMLAACLRQGVSVDLSAWPVPDEPPFQVLGDLILHVPELVPWLARHFGDPKREILYWSPNPWELSVHRRMETSWRRQLAREVEEGRPQKVLAAQWLRLLARSEETPRRPGKAGETPGFLDAESLRHSLDRIWRERGELASAEAGSHPELARALEVLAAPNAPPHLWVGWLTELRTLAHGTPGPLLLDAIAWGLRARARFLIRDLPPDLMLWLWSFPSLQEPLLAVLGEAKSNSEIGRIYRALRGAAASSGSTGSAGSIDLQGLLERWVLGVLRSENSTELVSAGDRDFLLLVVRTALAHLGPEDWLRLYEDGLIDPLEAALFLRELERVPAPERSTLHGLLAPVRDEWQKQYRFWLEQALAKSQVG